MKGNNYNTKYLRSLDHVSSDATGVVMNYTATYTDSKLGISNSETRSFRAVTPDDYLKLRVLIAPADVRAKLYERAGATAPDVVKVLGSKMGDQSGRVSWMFQPHLVAEFRALSFYVNQPVEPGQVFQFWDGDHARDFAALLENQLGEKYAGISDFASEDSDVIEMQLRLFPIYFAVNPNFKTREEKKLEEQSRAAQGASALDAVAATLKANRVVKTS